MSKIRDTSYRVLTTVLAYMVIFMAGIFVTRSLLMAIVCVLLTLLILDIWK